MRSLIRSIPALRRSLDEVDLYATAWAVHNDAVPSAGGPLWVVLGDSAAQGVGASGYDKGWVGQVRDRALPRHRLINLSRSGARTRDVIDVQWPAARELHPDIVTAVVGGNDALHTALPQWLRDIEDLACALPHGAVVSTVSRGIFERKTRKANTYLSEQAVRRGLAVADIWSHTGPPYWGLYADGFHPNDRGYTQWADAIVDALGGLDAAALAVQGAGAGRDGS